MIGGLLIDALVVAAVFAFEWAGPQLGATDAIRRAVACMVAALAAGLMRDPAGWALEHTLGTSVDLSNLVGMLAVGAGTYFAASSVLRWRNAQRAQRIGAGYDSEEFGNPVLAAIDGGVLGFGWAVLFISFLVLLPADNVVSRSAVRSFTGGLLVRQEGFLHWLSDGFPHYTQQLPKGRIGAVVGERSDLPMRGGDEPKGDPAEADALLRIVNRERRGDGAGALAFNPDLAGVAERHALSLANERQLSYRSPGGGVLDDRVRAALGEGADTFDEKIGLEVVWAHTPGNAGRGLRDSSRAAALLRDPKWSEVGIGIADAGWFNGNIYVLVLVATVEEAGAGSGDNALADGSGEDAGGDLGGDVGAAAAAGELA